MVMVQLAPAFTFVPQLFCSVKSPPALIAVMVSGPVPVLVRVTICGELWVLMTCTGKVRLVGDKLTAGATPVPVRLTICGVLGALSLTSSVAVRVPVAVGVKVMLIVQDPPGGTVLFLQVLVSAKSPEFVPVKA